MIKDFSNFKNSSLEEQFKSDDGTSEVPAPATTGSSARPADASGAGETVDSSKMPKSMGKGPDYAANSRPADRRTKAELLADVLKHYGKLTREQLLSHLKENEVISEQEYKEMSTEQDELKMTEQDEGEDSAEDGMMEGNKMKMEQEANTAMAEGDEMKMEQEANTAMAEGDEMKMEQEQEANTEPKAEIELEVEGAKPEMSEQEMSMADQEANNEMEQREFEFMGEDFSLISEKDVTEAVENFKIDFSEDVQALFAKDKESLTKDQMQRAQVVLEAAVRARLIPEVARIREQMNERGKVLMNKKIADLNESVGKNLDSYLNYVVTEWTKENQVAIDSHLKNQISENFIYNLRKLFLEHNIEIPADKVHVLDEYIEKTKSLEEIVNKEMAKNAELTEELKGLRKDYIFNSISEDLTLTQKESLKTLSESIQTDNMTDYGIKLVELKKSYFRNKTSTATTYDGLEPLNESVTKEENTVKDERMEAYIRKTSQLIKN